MLRTVERSGSEGTIWARRVALGASTPWLLTMFFGFRFVQRGEIIPSGLMAALGLDFPVCYFAPFNLRP